MKSNRPETKEEKLIANYRELIETIEDYFNDYGFTVDKLDEKVILDLIQAHKNIEKDIEEEED
jgi:hypothetical protein